MVFPDFDKKNTTSDHLNQGHAAAKGKGEGSNYVFNILLISVVIIIIVGIVLYVFYAKRAQPLQHRFKIVKYFQRRGLTSERDSGSIAYGNI